MRNVTFFLKAMIVLGFISGCDNDDQQPEGNCNSYVGFTQSPDHFCYVLCDFSISQDTVSFKAMCNNAIQLFEKVSEKYRIKFFRINTKYGEPSFFNYKPADRLDIESDMEIDNRNIYRKCMVDSLIKKLNEMSTYQTSNTCILYSFGKVLREMQSDIRNNADTVKIVLLSDLLEVCDNNGNNINLEKSLISNLSKIKAHPETLPTTSFAQYRNIRTSVVISSQKDSVDVSKLSEFWSLIFAKFNCPMEGSLVASMPIWTEDAY